MVSCWINRLIFSVTPSHARQGEVQTPPLLDLGLVAKLRRYAVPSVFVTAVRVAHDAVTRPIPGARPSGQRKRCSKTFPTFLSDAAWAFAASCGSPGDAAYLSAVFDARKHTNPHLFRFVASLKTRWLGCVP